MAEGRINLNFPNGAQLSGQYSPKAGSRSPKLSVQFSVPATDMTGGQYGAGINLGLTAEMGPYPGYPGMQGLNVAFSQSGIPGMPPFNFQMGPFPSEEPTPSAFPLDLKDAGPMRPITPEPGFIFPGPRTPASGYHPSFFPPEAQDEKNASGTYIDQDNLLVFKSFEDFQAVFSSKTNKVSAILNNVVGELLKKHSNYSPIAPDPIVNVTVCEPACGFSSNFNQP